MPTFRWSPCTPYYCNKGWTVYVRWEGLTFRRSRRKVVRGGSSVTRISESFSAQNQFSFCDLVRLDYRYGFYHERGKIYCFYPFAYYTLTWFNQTSTTTSMPSRTYSMAGLVAISSKSWGDHPKFVYTSQKNSPLFLLISLKDGSVDGTNQRK